MCVLAFIHRLHSIACGLICTNTGKLNRCIHSKDWDLDSPFLTIWVVVHGRSYLVEWFVGGYLLGFLAMIKCNICFTRPSLMGGSRIFNRHIWWSDLLGDTFSAFWLWSSVISVFTRKRTSLMGGSRIFNRQGKKQRKKQCSPRAYVALVHM